MNGVDRDVTERQIFVVIAVGSHVTAAGLETHLDIELAAFADCSDGQVAIQHFNVGVGLDLTAEHLAGTVHAQARDPNPFTAHLERDLLQVEDDVGGIFHHAWNGTEFVSHTLNADGGNGGALYGAEQDAAQARANGGSEAALERLCGEHAVALGESFGVSDQPFRLLKTFKHDFNFPFLDPGPSGIGLLLRVQLDYFEYNS